MADAPAGGSNWGALEVILAIVLGIGLIATLTGSPITPLIGNTPSSTSKTATQASTTYNTGGCPIEITNPTRNQSIDTQIDIAGSIVACLDGQGIPTSLNAQVVDSTGSVLSAFTPLPINKNFFGDINFSATVPLSGVAHSTAATLIISGPTADPAKPITIRIPIKLIARANPVPVVTNGVAPSTLPSTSGYATPTYVAPAPTPSAPRPASSSGGTTF